MSIKITPELLESVYAMLDTTKPFCNWNLPAVEDVAINVTKSTDRRGAYYRHTSGVPVIEISARCHHTLDAVIRTMAHEMVHVFEGTIGDRNDVSHSATWHKYADQVCKVHQWDRALF